jgi:Flp pilus assembly protein TadG
LQRASEQRGITVPLTAALIFTLLAMAALAIDVGIAYTARSSIQHAADSAALAGAFTFVNQQDQASAVDPAQAAREAAAAVANSNYVLGQSLGASAAPVSGTIVVAAPCTTMDDNRVCVDPANRRVTVKIMVPLGTYFASIWPSFGLLDVRAAATAEAAAHASGSHCMKPLLIANTAMNAPSGGDGGSNNSGSNVSGGGNNGNGNGGGGNGIGNACSNRQTFFDPITKQPTKWARDRIGSSFTISPVGSFTGRDGKDGNGDDDGNVAPNQYYGLNYGGGAGQESGYSCGIQHCLNDDRCKYEIDPRLFSNFTAGCMGADAPKLQTLLSVDPAVTRSAFQQLQGDTPDRFFGVGNYGQDASSASDTSSSVLTVPVWDNCNPAYPIAAGVQTYPVAGMVQLFLETPDTNGNIVAHLVGFTDCDSNTSGTGPGAIPVRLVNTTQ